MTEKKHAIKPYPLGAHVEDGAIRFAYASGKKDCGIILYDRESGKKITQKSRSAEKSGWEMSTAHTWNWIHSRSDISSMKRERIVPDLHARGFLSKPGLRKNGEKMSIALRYFPGEDFDWEQDEHPMLSYRESVC